MFITLNDAIWLTLGALGSLFGAFGAFLVVISIRLESYKLFLPAAVLASGSVAAMASSISKIGEALGWRNNWPILYSLGWLLLWCWISATLAKEEGGHFLG